MNAAAALEDPPRRRRASILVVDDEDAVRNSAADILRSEGYEVMEAADGQAALDILAERRFSVVVCDVRMPRADGIAVAEALGGSPPVVLMSAYSLDPLSKAHLADKVTAFLQKPFQPLRLVQEVGAAAGMAAMTSERGSHEGDEDDLVDGSSEERGEHGTGQERGSEPPGGGQRG